MNDDAPDEDFGSLGLIQTLATCNANHSLWGWKQIQYGTSRDADTFRSKPRDISFDLADPVRRQVRMSRKAVIPAGYTYFAQLIGHDIGNSVSLDAVPHTTRGSLSTKTKAPQSGRYNLIENPLTLETIYGPGPTLMHHLFDPDTFLFRVERMQMNSLVLLGPDGGSDHSIRALYDTRNRDTPFLHRMSVILMKFHNYLARDLRQAMGQRDWRDKAQIYAAVRAHMVAVWHDVIAQDFLATFVDQDRLPPKRYRMPSLDEVTLLHGVFRAFHALPRSAYFMDGQKRPLKRLLRRSPKAAVKADGWGLSWQNFFTNTPRGTKTGMTASISPRLTGRHGLVLSELDLKTAKDTNPLRLGDKTIKKVVKVLDPVDAARLDPATFSEAVNKDFGVLSGPEQMDAKDIERMPLFATLMLEAELYGTHGRFGPLGGLILTHMIEDMVSRVVAPTSPSDHLPRPTKMFEIIQYVEKREIEEDA